MRGPTAMTSAQQQAWDEAVALHDAALRAQIKHLTVDMQLDLLLSAYMITAQETGRLYPAAQLLIELGGRVLYGQLAQKMQPEHHTAPSTVQ